MIAHTQLQDISSPEFFAAPYEVENRFYLTTSPRSADAGNQSVSPKQLKANFDTRAMGDHLTLVEGLIEDTLPAYAEDHPDWKIALINLDVDLGDSSSDTPPFTRFYPQPR